MQYKLAANRQRDLYTFIHHRQAGADPRLGKGFVRGSGGTEVPIGVSKPWYGSGDLLQIILQ